MSDITYIRKQLITFSNCLLQGAHSIIIDPIRSAKKWQEIMFTGFWQEALNKWTTMSKVSCHYIVFNRSFLIARRTNSNINKTPGEMARMVSLLFLASLANTLIGRDSK